MNAKTLPLLEVLPPAAQIPALIGNSPAFLRAIQHLARIALSTRKALITGETGTGKEVVARAIHQLSDRRAKDPVPVNCAHLTPALGLNDLFGHVAGSYTGATAQTQGFVEQAHGSTLFLDEINSMPLEVQPHLLRFLESGEFRRVGSPRIHKADVRIIAATNSDLMQLVGQGRFREDLYYRLKEFRIHLPPLRDRRDDILLLAEHFMGEFAKESGEPLKTLRESARRKALDYRWPGNVRELRNTLATAVALTDGLLIDGSDIALDEPAEPSSIQTYWDVMESAGRQFLMRTLAQSGGNVVRAAQVAGMDRANFYEHVKKHQIKISDFRAVPAIQPAPPT